MCRRSATRLSSTFEICIQLKFRPLKLYYFALSFKFLIETRTTLQMLYIPRTIDKEAKKLSLQTNLSVDKFKKRSQEEKSLGFSITFNYFVYRK
jgi:hypothetical protein